MIKYIKYQLFFSNKILLMPSKKVKLLPKPDPSGIHLSKYGYSTSKKQSQRRASLQRTSKKHGALPVLKRLNLIRNLTSTQTSEKTKKAHDVMSKDVEYMKKLYSSEKMSRSKKGKKPSKK
jgi:hypothetical protein